MSVLEIRRIDGVFGIVAGDGAWRPIRTGGEPVRRFNAGWSPVCAIDGFAPLHMLSLRHEGGAEATWILDGDMGRLGDSLGQLPDRDRHVLREQADALLGLVFDRILAAPRPGPAGAADDLAALCEATVTELVGLVATVRAAGIAVVELNDPAADAALAPFGLRSAALRRTLDGSLPETFRERMRHGAMLRPSPFGGAPAEAAIGLPLDESVSAYRFADPSAGGTFYLTAQDYHDRTNGLLFPSLGLYCTLHHAPDLRWLLGMLLVHAARHQRRLLAYLATPARDKVAVNFVSAFPVLHLGHVVWNDLAALQELVETVAPDELPLVCVLGAALGGEPFGPIDRLFPEFAGRVLRPEGSWAQAAAQIYDNGWFFMRYKTRYVRGGTGARIRALAAEDPVLTPDRAVAARLKGEGRAFVLLGIRVGNRTLDDVTGFLTAAIDHLVARLGRVAIVIDGTNSRLGLDPTTSYGSFGPAGQDEPLIEETRIVFALRRRYQHAREVEIVSTVGAPVPCSVSWAAHCRFFVAPWGAGLAKYRWVCNLPGFVVTNRSNLGTPGGDLPIYHDPRYVEAPSPMRFVSRDHVLDAPGPHGFYGNFGVDPQALRAGIDGMIGLTAAP